MSYRVQTTRYYSCDGCSKPGQPEDISSPDSIPKGWTLVITGGNKVSPVKAHLCSSCVRTTYVCQIRKVG